MGRFSSSSCRCSSVSLFIFYMYYMYIHSPTSGWVSGNGVRGKLDWCCGRGAIEPTRETGPGTAVLGPRELGVFTSCHVADLFQCQQGKMGANRNGVEFKGGIEWNIITDGVKWWWEMERHSHPLSQSDTFAMRCLILECKRFSCHPMD